MENKEKTDNLSFSSIDCVSQHETVSNNIMAEDSMQTESNMSEIRLGKNPKRILHFCDGIIEEYSTDEEDEVDSKSAANTIDPKTLTWGPWFWYQTIRASNSSLKVCDYLGESLASFFGITTPKYQYEIEEYKRMVAEEQESKSRQDLEMGGWRKDSSDATQQIIQSSPKVAQKDAALVAEPTQKTYIATEHKPHDRY